MSNPKIIFMGTPEFAVPSLEAIYQKYGLTAIVTVPDKPKGRGLKLIPSPVKEKALELGVQVFQPEKLKDESFIQNIKMLEPDIIVVIAFRILPRELYTIPKLASFNIHGSLLPKYRGAAPINHAIINGETQSGLTSFILQDKVDTGDILLRRTIDIFPQMNAGQLHDAMMPIAAELSLETIDLLIKGNITALSQDGTLATPAPKLFKDNTKINWELPAQQINNLVRGLALYPAAWTNFDGSMMKILAVEQTELCTLNSGDYTISKKEFRVGTGDCDLKIIALQPPNKKSMPISDFLNGYRGLSDGKFE
jgi:methionyl-tRNA formyltransferase